MASFVGSTRSVIAANYTTAQDLTTTVSSPAFERIQNWASGTGENQANAFFSDRRTLTATSENLDLFGGLTDAFGTTLNFTKIKELWIQNRSAVAGEKLELSGTFFIGITGAGADGMLADWVDDAVKLVVGPGAQLRLSNPIDGYVVTDALQDILTIDALTATITYDIVLIGTV